MLLKLLIFLILFHQCQPMERLNKLRKSVSFTGSSQNPEDSIRDKLRKSLSLKSFARGTQSPESSPSASVRKSQLDEEFVEVNPLTEKERQELLDMQIDNEFEEISSDEAKDLFKINVCTVQSVLEPGATYRKEHFKVHVTMELPNMLEKEKGIPLDFNHFVNGKHSHQIIAYQRISSDGAAAEGSSSPKSPKSPKPHHDLLHGELLFLDGYGKLENDPRFFHEENKIEKFYWNLFKSSPDKLVFERDIGFFEKEEMILEVYKEKVDGIERCRVRHIAENPLQFKLFACPRVDATERRHGCWRKRVFAYSAESGHLFELGNTITVNRGREVPDQRKGWIWDRTVHEEWLHNDKAGKGLQEMHCVYEKTNFEHWIKLVEVNKWEEHKREEEAIFHGHIDHVDWHFRHAYFGVEYEGDHGSEND